MERVVKDFRKVCDTFETTEKWYYALKTTTVESNSLAAACGLKTIEELNTVFKCAGVLKNAGKWKDCLEHDPETLRKKLYDTEYNNANCKCMDDGGKKRHLFLCLGGKENPIIEKPSDQGKGMKSPRVQRNSEWEKCVKRLRKSIREYTNSSSPAEVTSGSSSLKMESSQGQQDDIDTDVEDEIQSPPPRVTRSMRHNCSNKVSPDKMDFTFITTSPQVQKHLKSRSRKELMTKLFDKYRHAGVPEEELQELEVPDEVKAPIEMFGIPFVPHLLRALLKSIVKTSEIFPELDLLKYNNYNGTQRVLVSLTQPVSKESYRRGGSQTQILKIADRMVPASRAISHAKREQLACERTTWLLESLLQDKNNEEAIRTTAKKKMKMIDSNKMPAADVGGMMKFANLTTTQFVKVKSYCETFFGNKLFCSKDNVRGLYEDVIVPKVEKWRSTNAIINFWFNELEDLIHLSLKDELGNPAFLESLTKINLVFAGDHGKGKF